MGNKSSSPSRNVVSANMRKERDAIRARKIQDNITKIDQQWMSSHQITTTNSFDQDQARIMLSMRDQVQRGDRPF